MKFSHFAGGMVMFSVLLGLLTFVYTGMEDNYGIIKGDLHNSTVKDQNTGLNVTSQGNIADQLTNMNLLKGINRLTDGLFKLTSINSFADVVGGVLMTGLGIIQTFYGIIIAPYDIVNLIAQFYVGNIPGAGLLSGLAALVVVYGGFIILSVKTGKDL